MRRLTLAIAIVLAISSCTDGPAPTALDLTPTPTPLLSLQQQEDGVVAGRILVRFAEGADPAAFADRNGVALGRAMARGRARLLASTPGGERALATRLAADPDVVYAEPDYLRQTTEIDPRLWAFYNPGDLAVFYTSGSRAGVAVRNYLSVADADEDNVEGYAAGGGPVSIASIDTGVDFNHPEFGGATLVAGWDFYDDDADPSDSDDHGTHTTGTMVGDAVGVAGVAGAASNVTVYVYRVCGPLGCPTSSIIDAIYAATDAGVVAMNLSLGGTLLSQAETDAIQYATDNDVLVIASAGNSGISTVSCPACDSNAISVAATDWLDQHAYYTSWGTGLDISAPGGELFGNTTDEAGIWSSVRNGGYAYFQGTSMAAPQVTGTAAIVASVTGLRGANLRARLEGTVDDLGTAGYDTQFGSGRLNSYRAVTDETLDEGGPPPPPPPSEVTASFTYSCNLTPTCTFDASSSTGAITSWDWSGVFTASGETTTHTFTSAGRHTVTLTVSDGSGSESTSQTILCGLRPTLRCRS